MALKNEANSIPNRTGAHHQQLFWQFLGNHGFEIGPDKLAVRLDARQRARRAPVARMMCLALYVPSPLVPFGTGCCGSSAFLMISIRRSHPCLSAWPRPRSHRPYSFSSGSRRRRLAVPIPCVTGRPPHRHPRSPLPSSVNRNFWHDRRNA